MSLSGREVRQTRGLLGLVHMVVVVATRWDYLDLRQDFDCYKSCVGPQVQRALWFEDL